ncbi:uncharacterized protein [Onthophagus taurus]|uniref:uncharacterized protein n=1 Tax=Onthophagus taurus TaxID=166361 RepID=UPI0039BE2B32
MSFTILVTVVSTLTWIGSVQSYQACNDPSPSKYFNEFECATTTWFVYGGSTDCDGCCITRNMTILEPGKILVQDTTTINGITTSKIYKIKRYGREPIYFVENDPNPIVLVDTDCKKYCVIYDYKNDDVKTFTDKAQQKPNFQNGLYGVHKCGSEMFDYNPKKACKGVETYQ